MVFSWLALSNSNMSEISGKISIRPYCPSTPTKFIASWLNSSPKILVSKFAYWFGGPERGDVVVFKTPTHIWDPRKPIYIKRVVGLGGETISFKGQLVANGEVDLGLYLVSEVQTVEGIELVGLLPSALQNFIVYGTAIPIYNAAPEAALAFVKFISDPTKGERWNAAGFELVSGS